jgi:hypothetical protein
MKIEAKETPKRQCSLVRSGLAALAILAFMAVTAIVWTDSSLAASAGQGKGKAVGRAAESAEPYDVKNLEPSKEKEWETVKAKLAKENMDCMEDCGGDLNCQEKCWQVYEFQLDREYQRLVYESGN